MEQGIVLINIFYYLIFVAFSFDLIIRKAMLPTWTLLAMAVPFMYFILLIVAVDKILSYNQKGILIRIVAAILLLLPIANLILIIYINKSDDIE